MSGSQQLLLGGSVAVPVDPYFYSVTSLLHGDGTNGGQNNTFLDSSTNNFTITRNGNTTQGSFSPFSQTGWSNYFDGTGDYLTLAPGAAFGFGTGDFTVETWFYYTGLQSPNTQYLFDARNSGQTNTWAFHANPNANTIVWFNGSSDFSSSSTISINQWNHVAYVRSGTTGSMYFNGVRVGTQTDSTNYSVSPTTSYIGARYNIAEHILGYMSNARVVKGTAVYSGTTYTVPTAPLTAITNTSLLTCQSNRFRDASTNNFTITRNGDVSVQPFSPFNPTTAYSTSSIGGSGYFDGSGDYLNGPSTGQFAPTGNFTISMWIYPTSFAAAYYVLAGSWNTGTSDEWLIQYDNTGAIRFLTTTDSTFSAAGVIKLNQWQFISISRSGSTLTGYVNGTSFRSYTLSGTVGSATKVVYIGAQQGTTWPYAGYMADFRLVAGSAESATPPTAPATAISGTNMLLNFTNGAIFDNAAVADYETVGNAQISTSVKKYGTGSLAFDGTGDWLSAPSSTQFGFGTGDFTVECWVYPNAFSANQTIIDARAGNTATPWLFGISSTGLARTYDGSTARTGGQLTAAAWNHVAWNRTAGVNNVYVNGTLGHTWSASTDLGSSKGLTIGAGAGATGELLTGYIDDIRISKGIGRYPYNFTPPTAALPDIGGTITLTADPYYEYTTLLLPGNGTNGAQNNTFLDSSTNAFTITRNGNTTQGTFSPFSQTGWGNYFDGNGDYLTVADSATLEPGSSDFTIECWVYPTATGSYLGVFSKRATNATYSPVQVLINNGTMELGVSTSGSSWAIATSASASPPLNQWSHIAVVRNGTASNNVTLYLNGISVVTGSVSSTALFDNSAAWAIGADAAAGTGPFAGYISNFRYVKGTAVYTGAFTPPTTPLTAITNTQLLTCQSNRFIDNSTNAFAITRNGDVSVQAFSPFNPTASWSAATYGGSGYFDGSGDYLTTPSNAAFGFGTGDFTIECWIWAASAANPSLIKRVFFFSDDRNNVDMDTSGNLEYYDGTVRNLGTCPLRAWTHVAISKTSGTVSAYVNGTRTYTGAESTNTSTRTFTVGAKNTGAEPWDGYITDVRILKGQGLYSGTTITVPTAPLTAVTNTQLLLSYTNAGIYDATSKNDLETVGNAQISTTQSKFGGSSIYFDGTGDGLTMPSAPLLQLGSGDFTIEAWIRFDKNLTYLDGDGIYSAALFGQQTTGGLAIVFRAASSAPPTSINYIVIGTSTTSRTISTALNTWYHVAVSRYAGTVYMFMDGVLQGTSFANTTNFVQSATQVGYLNITNFLDSFPGYINDLRVTKGIARYTSNFTPPTTAFLTL